VGKATVKITLKNALEKDETYKKLKQGQGMVLFEYEKWGSLLIEEVTDYAGKSVLPGRYYALRSSVAFKRQLDPRIRTCQAYRESTHFFIG
jgi:hypothetical protein